MNLALSLTAPIGGIIEDKIGGKKTIILSTLILCTGFFFMYFSRNIFIDYILMGLNGLGIAIGINITKKNACSFFMNNKALICGVINLIPGFLCAWLNIFNEKHILNPLSENPSIENIFYDKNIFLNFQRLIIFEICLLIFTCIVTLVLYIQNDPKETIKFGFAEKESCNKNKIIQEVQNEKQLRVKKAIYNIRAVKLFFMIFCFLPTINFINNTWRPIGIYYNINTYYLQLTGTLYSLIGCISSILFSLIGDKITFRILFVLYSLIITIVSFIFPLSFNNEIFFISGILTISFILNGFNIIIDPHIMKIYGMENYIKIGGVIRSSGGICEIFSVFFAFYIENNFSGNKNYVYKFMYIISGCFSMISLLFGLLESDDKFNYDS